MIRNRKMKGLRIRSFDASLPVYFGQVEQFVVDRDLQKQLIAFVLIQFVKNDFRPTEKVLVGAITRPVDRADYQPVNLDDPALAAVFSQYAVDAPFVTHDQVGETVEDLYLTGETAFIPSHSRQSEPPTRLAA